ncbi:MAG: efflux RND transporter permease subunit, partial [Aeoliella sp.]
MLTSIIRGALENRLLVLAAAVVLLAVGGWQATRLPIDVFPNLNRPRVVLMVEAHGMAPEEVETLITIPLETVFNGATDVQAVRTTSGIGLSVVYVEFNWGTDIYLCRQIVAERLALVADVLPPEVNPQLMPISSIMGQIVVFGMVADDQTSDMELRTVADWTVRRDLLTIPGVSQVVVMGGDRKQYQVLVDPDRLIQYGATLHEVKEALEASNQNTAGGYLDEQGPNELLVRSLGRIEDIEDLRQVVVKHRDGQSVRLEQVADVVEGAQVKRGSSAAHTRDEDGEWSGGSAVVLTVMKQPQADTRKVTDEVRNILANISLPPGVRVIPGLYEQKEFIDRAIDNVKVALRDGAMLVVIVLFVFLVNLRTTLITLTAIPLSILLTAIVFALFDMSVNTMTLGGLAVAIGELVDDAIVDVENIFRRLRENRSADKPLHPLLVVFQASCEIRSSIVYGTLIVMLVFVPLFALSGMEGRLFTPLGIAYIVSIAASLLVSLTVTPVLSYWLLAGGKLEVTPGEHAQRDGILLRVLKRVAEPTIAMSLYFAKPVILLAALAVAIAAWGLARLDRDFLPPFNEGAMQINALLPPGTSLATSTRVAQQVEQRLAEVDDIVAFVRKTGRAELDEHAEGVHVSEFIATINPETEKSRQEVILEIEDQLANVPGIVVSVEQPLAHLISHMLSGVKAQVAIKLYGDELEVLRTKAKEIEQAITGTEGVRNLQVEQQISISQLRIEADSRKLAAFGLRRDDVNEFVETAMQGEVVSQVLQGQRTFDLVVRLGEEYREDLTALRRLQIDLPTGGSVKLEDVAHIYESKGPNSISR